MSAKRARDEDAADAGAVFAPDETRKPKKAKHGFRVGPENLPDGAWRRKVTKIKKELITKAKVKKQYSKVKAEYQKQVTTTPAATAANPTSTEGIGSAEHHNNDQSAAAPAPIHPERQAMLDSDSARPTPNTSRQGGPRAPVTGANTEPNDPSAPREPSQQPQQDQQPDVEHPQDRPHQKRPRRQKPDYYTKELAAAERAKQQAEERAAEFARREQERQKRITERERYRKAMAKAKAPGRDGRPKVGRESKLLLERVQRIMGK